MAKLSAQMTNQEAFGYVNTVFTDIIQTRTLNKLNTFIDKYEFQEVKEEYLRKYPVLGFRITKKDFGNFALIFSKDNKLKEPIKIKDPIAKILAAFIWKQGDLANLRHLFLGMSEVKTSTQEQSIILKQFGRSLLHSTEPIADQHVLRAFEIFKLKSWDDTDLIHIRQKKNYDVNDEEILKKYRSWFKDNLIRISKDDQKEAKKVIDFLLYATGKKVKGVAELRCV